MDCLKSCAWNAATAGLFGAGAVQEPNKVRILGTKLQAEPGYVLPGWIDSSKVSYRTALWGVVSTAIGAAATGYAMSRLLPGMAYSDVIGQYALPLTVIASESLLYKLCKTDLDNADASWVVAVARPFARGVGAALLWNMCSSCPCSLDFGKLGSALTLNHVVPVATAAMLSRGPLLSAIEGVIGKRKP